MDSNFKNIFYGYFPKKNNCLQRAYFIMFMPSYIESLPSDVDQMVELPIIF
jgi:hypothetical protein